MLKSISVLDYYLWKYLVPELKPAVFKLKFMSLLALLYIALFPLPRKFLKNYFLGKGKSITIDSKSIIQNNPEVLDLLKNTITGSQKNLIASGALDVSQLLLSDPNYRYAFGSFRIRFVMYKESVRLRVISTYNFDKDNDRITRHLHGWMHSLNEKKRAHDFDIHGTEWAFQTADLKTIRPKQVIRKKIDYNRLYV